MYICLKSIYTLKGVHRYNEGYKHNPELSTAAMFIGCIMGGCEIPKRQEQSVDKRLFLYMSVPTLSASVEASARET